MKVVKDQLPPHPGNRINYMVGKMIRIVALIVLLGYLMMVIMVPTNTFSQIWLLTIEEKAKATYFGIQGAPILIYTFTILFVAILGCFYLHLAKTFNKGWRRPMIVKGPLGIVSGIEMVFLTMFITLLIWSFSNYTQNRFITITPESAESVNPVVSKQDVKWQVAALRFGFVGNICFSLLFFPVTRASTVLPLFGLTSEGSIKYHMWIGNLVMIFFTGHGIAYIGFWAVTDQISEVLKWDKSGISNLAGELSLLAGFAIWATALTRIRRKNFEVFFYTHYLYILFVLFFIFHVGISYSYIMLPGFYLFMVDRYLRFLQSRKRVRLVSARILPCKTLELNFSKSPDLRYNSTSIMFINVPSISRLQWHPFTVISNCDLEPERLSVMIKSEGSWSQKLYKDLSFPIAMDHLEVSVEGPYGPASTDFLRHDKLVMVSGGSGITPFISIIRELIFASKTNYIKIPEVLLICAFRNSSELAMLELLLPISETQCSLANLQLKIDAYVTRDKKPFKDSWELRTLLFKSLTTEAPISAILGSKNWLWLVAIISSSFIIFLIIIGLITRYYIYPIDQDFKPVFSSALRISLTMLAMSISIAITASAAVLWNKEKSRRVSNRIHCIESPPPLATLGWYFDAEREMKSVPIVSLSDVTTVHYGERPDLKKFLFDCKESSVGVLVSGPNKMRQEAATICSCGLVDNLHFESISFSW
ncbi:hypothetical protein K2173_025401 [Erythroxylum novogranatense]|uniref:ferric-chelate reductase (NADH) n=1 Tax=Erythroxylum novogranatense TaxID=1862640 RepID=A0AAV8UF19_9ROSI|nr:hypothetical protein K2173_025401 [Erythroxylum novogranatense]